jgi:HSP20 family protein
MAPASRAADAAASPAASAGDRPRPDEAGPAEPGAFAPAADVFETAEGLVIEVELPGVAAEAIRLTAEAGALLIEGTKADPGAGGKRYVRAERAFGAFRRRVPLPGDARAGEATAQLREGVLRIVVPRGAAPRRIAIADAGD